MRAWMNNREWALLSALLLTVVILFYSLGERAGLRQYQIELEADNAALSLLADTFERLYLEVLLEPVLPVVPKFQPFPLERKTERGPIPLLPNLGEKGGGETFGDGGILPRFRDIPSDPWLFQVPRQDPLETLPVPPQPFPYEFHRFWWNYVDRPYMDC